MDSCDGDSQGRGRILAMEQTRYIVKQVVCSLNVFTYIKDARYKLVCIFMPFCFTI